MYRKPSPQITIDDFILPFLGKLSAENRWVQLTKLIPWDEIEEQYAFCFPVGVNKNASMIFIDIQNKLELRDNERRKR